MSTRARYTLRAVIPPVELFCIAVSTIALPITWALVPLICVGLSLGTCHRRPVASAFLKGYVCDQRYWRHEQNQTPVCASADGRGAPGAAGQLALARCLCPAPCPD